MARFYELTAKGNSDGTLVINRFWYRDPRIGLATQSDLETMADAWQSQRQPNYVGIHTSNWTLDSLIVQGYAESWERSPYLPYERVVNVVGADASAAAPPVLAAVMGCTVEPVDPARRRKPTGEIVLTPVRRGYWSMSPLNEAVFLPDGTFYGYGLDAGLWYNVEQDLGDPMTLVTAGVNVDPVIVSSPLPDEVVRGWGYIRAAKWRREASTRRSRKLGKGA